MTAEKCQSRMTGILKLYILLMVFVVPEEYTKYVILGSGLLVLLTYISGGFLTLHIEKDKRFTLFLFVVLFITVLINLEFSEYPIDKMLQSSFQLLVTAVLLSGKVKPSSDSYDWFYIIFTAFLIYGIITNYFSGSILTFTNFSDKNYAAVIVFLYFLYCLKSSYKMGIAVSVLYILVSTTRLYVIGLIICTAVWIFSKTEFSKKHSAFTMTPKKTLLLFVLFFLLTIVICYVWSHYVVGINTTAYKLSLNDTSNAIRANSNLYAFKVLENDLSLLWRGYDSQMKVALGLGSSLIEEHATYMYYRLVQPHNSFINMLLTHGILYSITYFTILARIFAKHFKLSNIVLWLPFLVVSLFMHSLLSTFFLTFWAIVVLPESHLSVSGSLLQNRNFIRRQTKPSFINSPYGGNK